MGHLGAGSDARPRPARGDGGDRRPRPDRPGQAVGRRLRASAARSSRTSNTTVRSGATPGRRRSPTSTTTRTTSTSTPIRTRCGSGCATSSRCTTTTSTTSMRHPVGRRRARAQGSWPPDLEPRHDPRADQGEHRDAPGMVIFDDPPSHTAYRGLMSRVFTPRKMNAIEPEVRRYCQVELDALDGADRVRRHRGARRQDADACHRHAARHPRGGPASDPRPVRQRSPPRLGRRLQLGVHGLRQFAPRATSATTSTGGSRIPPTT